MSWNKQRGLLTFIGQIAEFVDDQQLALGELKDLAVE